MSERVIINVIGEPASGKEFICKEFAKYGCDVYVPSGTIKNYAKQHGLTIACRADSAAIKRQMLAEDPFAMVRPALDSPRDVVIEGMRAVHHVLQLQEYAKTIVVAAMCDSDEERFRRAMANFDARGGRDKTSLADFLADGQAERYNPNPLEPSIECVMGMADYQIDTLALNKSQVSEAVSNIYRVLD